MPRRPKPPPIALAAMPTGLFKPYGKSLKTVEAIRCAMLAVKTALIERALEGEPHVPSGRRVWPRYIGPLTHQRHGKGAPMGLTENDPIRPGGVQDARRACGTSVWQPHGVFGTDAPERIAPQSPPVSTLAGRIPSGKHLNLSPGRCPC